MLWSGLHSSAERSLTHLIQIWSHRGTKTRWEFAPILSDGLIVPFVPIFIAVLSLLTITCVLLFSTTKASRLRRWLFFVTLCVPWFGLANGWRDIAWSSKQVRFTQCVPKLQSLTAGLHHDWPEGDGKVEDLGPFMAYPIHKPKTLLLLIPPRVEIWDKSAMGTTLSPRS